MKKIPLNILRILLLLSITCAYSQVSYKQSGTSSFMITGTSTLHDWEMTSTQASFNAVFDVSPEGVPTQLHTASLTIPAESLKSGKSAMDKNAYTSLKTDKHKQISFQLTSSRITAKAIVCSGNLTIAGTTKQIDLDIPYEVRNGVILCKGQKKIKMTEYNVEPPTFMFGSVKTGDEINVIFDLAFAPVKL